MGERGYAFKAKQPVKALGAGHKALCPVSARMAYLKMAYLPRISKLTRRTSDARGIIVSAGGSAALWWLLLRVKQQPPQSGIHDPTTDAQSQRTLDLFLEASI